MLPDQYKRLQADWVSDNVGTTPQEIALVATVLHLTLLISRSVISTKSFIYEAVTIIIPIIVAVTDPFGDSTALPGMMLIIGMICLLFNGVGTIIDSASENLDSRPQWLTNFRALTYLVTGICILAVDFKLFPQRFAKTETFGYGLMDLGVGFFIFCNGLVYKRQSLLSSISGVPILLFLGAIRFLTTSSIDYQVHISEYGVHWNFFITLALCHCIVGIVSTLTGNFLYLSVVFCAIHEMALLWGMQDWVMGTDPRTDLLSANKEGLSSVLGYVSLFYISATIGDLSRLGVSRFSYFIKVLCVCSIAWALTFAFEKTVGISRRLCNLGFISWVVAMSTMILLQLISVDIYLRGIGRKRPSILLDSINNNGLLFFLICNVLTGLINVSVQTLLLPYWPSMVIIVCYICTSTLIVYKLREKNIVVKFSI